MLILRFFILLFVQGVHATLHKIRECKVLKFRINGARTIGWLKRSAHGILLYFKDKDFCL